MKVLALNSGSRPDAESYTSRMLSKLVEGMREAGAEVEVIALREKKIRHCIGCFSCWTKTPGQCIHKDDMTGELFPKLLACDLAVFATPLYFHTINARMATFMERTLPAALPFFEEGADGKTRHPMRHEMPASVLLSVCGFPEASEFDAMTEFFKKTRESDAGFVAVICRAGASLLDAPALVSKAKDVFDAMRSAGHELVHHRQVFPETLARITQPLGDAATFGKMSNIYWKTCIAEGVTPKEFDERKLIPRPQTLEDFLFVFPYGINVAAAGGKTIRLQFNFSGDVSGPCCFTVRKGRVEALSGVCDSPDLTIDAPFGLWMDILTRKADGQRMFMEKKYTVQGDLGLMMRLFQKDAA